MESAITAQTESEKPQSKEHKRPVWPGEDRETVPGVGRYLSVKFGNRRQHRADGERSERPQLSKSFLKPQRLDPKRRANNWLRRGKRGG